MSSSSGKKKPTLAQQFRQCVHLYSPLRAVGEGAYGLVCEARRKSDGKRVAIKRVSDALSHPIDAKRCLREIKIIIVCGEYFVCIPSQTM